MSKYDARLKEMTELMKKQRSKSTSGSSVFQKNSKKKYEPSAAPAPPGNSYPKQQQGIVHVGEKTIPTKYFFSISVGSVALVAIASFFASSSFFGF